MTEGFKDCGLRNHIELGANVALSGYVLGNDNRIVVQGTSAKSTLHIGISGHGNHIRIGAESEIKGLGILCGNHVPSHRVQVEIGDEFTIESGGRFYLYNSGNQVKIGARCMFSSGVTLRCGESPHLLFDKDSGDYLDQSEGVFIGDHVWVGEGAYLTKAVSIGDESVVGARAVVTRRFAHTHVALAGNPARVVRENLQWIRNPGLLAQGDRFHQAYHAQASRFQAMAAALEPAQA